MTIAVRMKYTPKGPHVFAEKFWICARLEITDLRGNPVCAIRGVKATRFRKDLGLPCREWCVGEFTLESEEPDATG